MLTTLNLSRIAWVGSSDMGIVGDYENVVARVLHFVLHDRTVEGLRHGWQPVRFQEGLIVLLAHEFLGSSLNLDAGIVRLLIDDIWRKGRILNSFDEVLRLLLSYVFL